MQRQFLAVMTTLLLMFDVSMDNCASWAAMNSGLPN
jgi:hypothetical protein